MHNIIQTCNSVLFKMWNLKNDSGVLEQSCANLLTQATVSCTSCWTKEFYCATSMTKSSAKRQYMSKMINFLLIYWTKALLVIILLYWICWRKLIRNILSILLLRMEVCTHNNLHIHYIVSNTGTGNNTKVSLFWGLPSISKQWFYLHSHNARNASRHYSHCS